jgi:hypothetical protein
MLCCPPCPSPSRARVDACVWDHGAADWEARRGEVRRRRSDGQTPSPTLRNATTTHSHEWDSRTRSKRTTQQSQSQLTLVTPSLQR